MTAKTLKLATTVLVCVAVLYVFVAPVLHLDPTALRASQQAKRTFAVLQSLGDAIFGIFIEARPADRALVLLGHPLSPIELDCERLC